MGDRSKDDGGRSQLSKAIQCVESSRLRIIETSLSHLFNTYRLRQPKEV